MYLSAAHAPRAVRRPLSLRTSVFFWQSSRTLASSTQTLFRLVTRTQSFLMSQKNVWVGGFKNTRTEHFSISTLHSLSSEIRMRRVCLQVVYDSLWKAVGSVFLETGFFSRLSLILGNEWEAGWLARPEERTRESHLNLYFVYFSLSRFISSVRLKGEQTYLCLDLWKRC